jgi:hypothetical protein
MDKAAVYKAIMDHTVKDYWQRRGNFRIANIPNIDWDLIGAAFVSLLISKK